MAKVSCTLRTTAQEERTIKLYEPLPSSITVAVKAESHNTGAEAAAATEAKKFGPKTYTRVGQTTVYEE